MDIRLTREDLELSDRARSFTERVLIPLELECEEHDGLGAESSANAKQAVLDAGFNAINHARDDGGRSHSPTPPRTRRRGTSSRRAGGNGVTRTRSPRSMPVRIRRWSAPRLGATATPG